MKSGEAVRGPLSAVLLLRAFQRHGEQRGVAADGAPGVAGTPVR